MQEQILKGSINRRHFLRNSGLTGLSLAGAAIAADQLGALDHSAVARKLGLGTTPVEAATLSAADIQVLQFALNIEYAEAEFYSFALTGKSLEANGVDVTGPVGTLGPTTGGAQIDLANVPHVGPLLQVAEQVYQDELNHLALIRSLLGSNTIAKPAIRLDVLGNPGTLPVYLQLARGFSVIAISAYGGSIAQLDSAVLTTVGQIALVEALHGGNIQLLTYLNGFAVPPIDTLDVTPPPSGPTFFDNKQGLAVIRTTSQVLQIAYLNGASGTNAGGFFPNGVNGPVTTV